MFGECREYPLILNPLESINPNHSQHILLNVNILQFNIILLLCRKPNSPPITKGIPINTTISYHNLQENGGTSGVAFLIKNSLYATTIKLSTDLMIQAIKVHSSYPQYIINLYWEYGRDIRAGDVEDLIKQVTHPVVFLDGFNVRNTLWGVIALLISKQKLQRIGWITLIQFLIQVK